MTSKTFRQSHIYSVHMIPHYYSTYLLTYPFSLKNSDWRNTMALELFRNSWIIFYRLIDQQILTGVLLFSPLFCYILSCLFFNFQEVQLKSDRSSAQQYFVFVLCVFVAGNLINVLMCCSIKWSMYRYFFPGIAYNWNQNSTRLIE